MAIKSLILVTAFLGIAFAVDYCALPTCLDKHIACNNKGVGAPSLIQPKYIVSFPRTSVKTAPRMCEKYQLCPTTN